MGYAGILELVAERWTEDVVYPVVEIEVLGVGDAAKRGREFKGEVFTELAQGFLVCSIGFALTGRLWDLV